MPSNSPKLKSERVAAIGIGSNSVRLLIAVPAKGRIPALERLETVTRLASYRSQAGGVPLLREDAIRLTMSMVSTYALHARECGAALLGVVATEAVRAAANRADLIEPIEQELGLPVTIISGEEEAELGWQTISMGYEQGTDLGVIDIGGASTDLSVGASGSETPQDVESLKLGSRTLMHRYRLDRPVQPAEVKSVVEALTAEHESRLRSLRPAPEIAVVIGGTASVLAEMRHQSLDGDSWTDAITERAWLERTLWRIAPVSLERRVKAGVPRDRADVIVAGGAILLTVLEVWDLHHFYISQRNILDGFIQKAIQSGS